LLEEAFKLQKQNKDKSCLKYVQLIEWAEKLASTSLDPYHPFFTLTKYLNLSNLVKQRSDETFRSSKVAKTIEANVQILA